LPSEHKQDIPPDLEKIALNAMARKPSDRYQSAQAMADDIRLFLNDRNVLTRPTLYIETLRTRVAQHLKSVNEWLDLRLIYEHEFKHLREAYARLELSGKRTP